MIYYLLFVLMMFDVWCMIIIIRLAAIVCPNEKKTSAIGLDTALRQAEPVQ